MSRSTHHKKVGRNWRHRRRAMIRFERRATRHVSRQKVRMLLPLRNQSAVEVMADGEEEAGRLQRAEDLRNFIGEDGAELR